MAWSMGVCAISSKASTRRVEVELIPHGLNVIISNKKKEEEPFSLLQQIVEYFSGLKPKHEELIKQKYNHLFVLNRHLLRRLSKK